VHRVLTRQRNFANCAAGLLTRRENLSRAQEVLRQSARRVRRPAAQSLMRCAVVIFLAAGLAPGCAPPTQRDSQAVFDDAFAAFQAGQWPRAYDGFTRYLRSGPEATSRGEVYYYRGQALVHLRRRSEARNDFQQALAAKPGQPILDFIRRSSGTTRRSAIPCRNCRWTNYRSVRASVCSESAGGRTPTSTFST
jgi:tetratricopeptide (TPR) repeat protein